MMELGPADTLAWLIIWSPILLVKLPPVEPTNTSAQHDLSSLIVFPLDPICVLSISIMYMLLKRTDMKQIKST